jgi:hypothetical protein
VRGCGGEVGREAERAHEQWYVDHAAADPEEARDKADTEAVEGAAATGTE